MKTIFALFLLAVTQCDLFATSDLYTRALNFDGLPLRLSDGRASPTGEDKINEYGSIDMAAYFMDVGVDVPMGGMIIYNVKSGSLIARLTKEGHELLDTALEYIFRHENQIAITRAYVSLLGPLPDDERVSKVLDTGFMPDPLIASLITRIKEIEAPIIETDIEKKLFPDEKLFPKSESSISDSKRAKIIKRVAPMKQSLAKLLQISLERLGKELEIIDDLKAGAKSK